MAKIFVSWPGFSAEDPDTGARLIEAGHELLLYPKLGARSAGDLSKLVSGCTAAIVSTDPFTAEVLTSNPTLRIIARVGVGTDSIDLAAANARRVAVSITPGMNSKTVADHTLALVLGLMRKIAHHDVEVKQGHWDRVGAHTPAEFTGKTVGVVGAGEIGRAVMRRLAGFDVHLVYFDPAVPAVVGTRRAENLDELLRSSDVITLHAPLTPKTHHLINATTLGLMKTTAFLINTARGPLIDQDALFAALRRGSIAGAALDVFTEEPPPPGSLTEVPNLLTSPHIAALSRESIRRMTISATSSVLAALRGEVPNTVINPEALVAPGSLCPGTV